MALLTDGEINKRLQEPKRFPDSPRLKPRAKSNTVYEEAELPLTTESGQEFKVRIRKHRVNPLKFSVILLFLDRENKEWLRLMRCNGKHEHTNKIERHKFEGFHVHIATQRYMDAGLREDAFAEKAGYSSFAGALEYFFKKTNCHRVGDQPTLFK